MLEVELSDRLGDTARLVDVEAVDAGAGSTRYAAILVDNTGPMAGLALL